MCVGRLLISVITQTKNVFMQEGVSGRLPRPGPTQGKTTKLSDSDIEPSVAEAKKAIKVNLLTIYQLSNKHAIHLTH